MDEGRIVFESVMAFVCFCLAASGTYYLNDLRDIEADRLHPKKRFRPIASGAIPVEVARVVGPVLIVAAISLGFLADWRLSLAVASYLALTTCYTLWLKHLTVFDVVGVAAGFVLRAIGGAAATGVPISNWFFMVASFGSLLMVVGKREGELAELEGRHHGAPEAGAIRATLDEYSESYLAYLRTVSSAAVLMAYILWAFETATEKPDAAVWLELSVLPFVCAILRYALLLDQGKGSEPEQLVLGDRPLQIAGLVWAVVYAGAIYLV
jgi:decaprenyl-phosphate phosphoribosyltransferase